MKVITNTLKITNRDRSLIHQSPISDEPYRLGPEVATRVDGSVLFDCDSSEDARAILEGDNFVDEAIEWLDQQVYDKLGEGVHVTRWSFAKWGIKTIDAEVLEINFE